MIRRSTIGSSSSPTPTPDQFISFIHRRADIWIVFSLGSRTRIKRFRTLLDALNSIRSVLVEAMSEDVLTNNGYKGKEISTRSSG